MNTDRAILVTGTILALTLVLFETTSLDLLVQDRLYDPASGWRVRGDAPWPRLIFYHAPTAIVGAILVGLLVRIALPASRSIRIPFSRRDAVFLFVCISLIVASAWLLKNLTGVFSPREIARYGGEQPYRKLLEAIPYVPGRARGDGFPATHCSGGFALMSLYFILDGQTARRLGLLCGLAFGWIVGIYQMLKGAHYLSHTIVTMILAWMMVQVLSRVIPVQRENGAAR